MAKAVHPGIRLLTEIIEPSGISISELARLAGVSRQSIYSISKGNSKLSPRMIGQLRKVLEIPPSLIEQWVKDYELNAGGPNASNRNSLILGDTLLPRSLDIAHWADTIEARHVLPRLIRLLIHGAVSEAFIDFPAYQDIQSAGWDGFVDSPRRNGFVPSGRSGWELSTNSQPATKAEKDYQNRRKAATSNGEQFANSYVALTARKWPGKKAWAAEKNKDKVWSRVYAYDATDLEQWLETTPNVAIWLAEQIGKRPRGILSLAEFWEQFRRSTSPAIAPQLLLAGRSEQAKTVRAWFQNNTSVLRVLADSSDEALAFLAATLAAEDDLSAGDALAGMILVSDPDHVRQLARSTTPLTLGWQLDDPSALGVVIERGHRVFVPLGRSVSDSERFDVQLPRLERAQFISAITQSLTSEPNGNNPPRWADDEAARRARRSGRSVTAYRRLFASAELLQIPRWADPEKSADMVPFLLTGSWNENNELDRQVLSEMAGTPYEELSRRLTRWKTQPDAPLRKIGDTWLLTAPMDSWSLIASSITEDDRVRFSRIARKVLSEKDPTLTVAPEARWQAGFSNIQTQYSSSLRRGLAESLIFYDIIAEPENPSVHSRLPARIVYDLMNSADADKWRSLHDLLPYLAEAAPESFLKALENDLHQDKPAVLSLFESEGGTLGEKYRHPGLLWALEVLAWYKEHFVRAALILAKLACVAPNPKLVNKPINSLREIFCVWHRNTEADPELRLQCLDRILKTDSKSGWSFLCTLLPKNHEMSVNNAEPRWRAKPDLTPVTYGEIWQVNEQLVRRVLDAAEADPERLGALISHCGSWSVEQRRELLSQIRSAAPVDPKLRSALWTALRDFLASQGKFSIPVSELPDWNDLTDSLSPLDILDRSVWLFESEYIRMPNLSDAAGGGLHDGLELVRQADSARQRAVLDILARHGRAGLLQLADRVDSSYLVGFAAASVVDDRVEAMEIVQSAFNSDSDKVRNFGLAYAQKLKDLPGGEIVYKFRYSSPFLLWSAKNKADYCLAFPLQRSTWESISELGQEVEERYWKQVRIFIGTLGKEDSEFVITKFIRAGRIFSALEQAGMHPDKLSAALLVEVLDLFPGELAQAKERSADAMLAYYLERIFGQLRAIPLSDEILGKLEWQYLPLFRHNGAPLVLHRMLQDNPQFFVEVLKHAYRADDQQSNDREITPEERARASAAWDLLNGWHTPPGTNRGGFFDYEALTQWVRATRNLCREANRLDIGDDRIARVVGYAPSLPNDVWPSPVVRDLIEELDSDIFDSALHASRINQRGVYTKHPLDGGRAERSLASQYRSWASRCLIWPRTARLLNGLAETYENFGKLDDVTSAQFDLD